MVLAGAGAGAPQGSFFGGCCVGCGAWYDGGAHGSLEGAAAAAASPPTPTGAPQGSRAGPPPVAPSPPPRDKSNNASALL